MGFPISWARLEEKRTVKQPVKPESDNICWCGFEAKTKAGLNVHQRKCKQC